MTNTEIYLPPIGKKDAHEIKFKLNSDDFSRSDIKKIRKHLRSRGEKFKDHSYHSKIKCMSWQTFRIARNKYIDFHTNDILAREIIKKALS